MVLWTTALAEGIVHFNTPLDEVSNHLVDHRGVLASVYALTLVF